MERALIKFSIEHKMTCHLKQVVFKVYIWEFSDNVTTVYFFHTFINGLLKRFPHIKCFVCIVHIATSLLYILKDNLLGKRKYFQSIKWKSRKSYWWPSNPISARSRLLQSSGCVIWRMKNLIKYLWNTEMLARNSINSKG